MESIFIQIASYRDPELIPTLDDLLLNASHPERLTICVAHQYDEKDKWDSLEKYKNDSRFIVIEIPHLESGGACWARNQVQQHYDNQDYTLQLDSHHRFIKGWDVRCIDMLKDLQEKGHSKPLLTSYIPSYKPSNDPAERHNKPWGMSFDRFTPEGVVFFLPYYIDSNTTEPIPARFYSAHFAFTLGVFCKEVQHDPLFYFHGEEITIGVRAFTHGYSLFHPHEVLAWHEYTREGRTKHWDDHSSWGTHNNQAHQRTRLLLGVDGQVCTPCNKNMFQGYDIGTVRTLKEYELYAGIRFKDRTLTQSCISNIDPPGDLSDTFLLKFKHAIDLNKSFFPEKDYNFAALVFEDINNKEVYRQDISKQEINEYLNGSSDSFTVWREYNGPKPHHWILWPNSAHKGWGLKTTVNL